MAYSYLRLIHSVFSALSFSHTFVISGAFLFSRKCHLSPSIFLIQKAESLLKCPSYLLSPLNQIDLIISLSSLFCVIPIVQATVIMPRDYGILNVLLLCVFDFLNFALHRKYIRLISQMKISDHITFIANNLWKLPIA